MKCGFQGCVLPYFGSRCQVALPTYAAQKEAQAANRPLMYVIRLGKRGSGGCLESRGSINRAHATPLSLFLIWSNRREKFDLVAACAFKTSCSLLFVSVSRLVSPSPSTQTQRKAHPRLRRRTLSQKQTCHAKTESSYLHLCFAVLMNVRMFFHQHPVR